MQIEHVGAAASAARYIYMLHESLPNVQPPPYLPTSGCICTPSARAEKEEILIFGWAKGVTDQFLSLRKYQLKMVQLKFQSH